MAKLCPRGKAAAKRKFKVYPSAYANMYASAVCSGKIVPGGRKKKMGGGSVSQERKMVSNYKQGGVAKGCGAVMEKKKKSYKKILIWVYVNGFQRNG
jgi:hypothetical protein